MVTAPILIFCIIISRISHGLQMTQGTVTVQDLLILGGIVELDLAGAEALGYFEHEASRFLHVREMGRASGTAGDGGYGRDRHANHRRGGHGAGLHDAVQVIDAVSVGLMMS